MCKTISRIVLTSMAVLLSILSYSQKAYYYGPDHIAEVGDTVVLVMNEFEGDIQWQRSDDLENWSDIEGATNDRLIIHTDSTAYYRSKVVAGNCPPFYSDTTYLSVVQYSQNAVNVDNRELKLISDSSQVEQGIFTYQGSDTANIDQGNIAFDPSLIRDFKISWFKLKRAKFAIKGTIKNDMDLTVSAGIGAEVEKEIKLFKASVGPVWMGPVPLFFEYTLKAVFTAGFSASGEMTYGFDTQISTTAGASYDRDNDPDWSTIWNNNASFESTTPQFGGQVSTYAQMSMVPEFFINIAKTAGPYINVQPYLRSQFDVDILEWDFNVYGGVKGNLGFKVEILGFGIADYYATYPVKRWNIYHTSGFFDPDPPVVSTSVEKISAAYAYVGGQASCPQPGVTINEWGVYYGTQPNPVETGKKEKFGKGQGDFSGLLSRLDPETTYYVKAYASNDGGTSYGKQKSFTTIALEFEDGGIYQWYNDYEPWGEIYGALYSYYTVVNPRGLCPDGWHVPTDQDWKNLELYLGMSQDRIDESYARGNEVALQLKGVRQIPEAHPRWGEDNGGTDQTGMGIYPGGYVTVHSSSSPSNYRIGTVGEFWTSTPSANEPGQAWDRNIYIDIFRILDDKKNLKSIRCIQD